MEKKYKEILRQFKDALVRLEEVLEMEKDDIIRDSSIKRFELCFDLSWKLLKYFLEEEKGVVCRSPKDCFKEAYTQGIIEYDDFWLQIVDLRNETTHTYKLEVAERVYNLLPKILRYFQELLDNIESYAASS